MSIVIREKYAENMTYLERTQVAKLRIRDGFLVPTLSEYENAVRDGDHSRGAVVFLAKNENNKIIGWSILFLENYICLRGEYMCFVTPKYRRRGVGSKLMKHALQRLNLEDIGIFRYHGWDWRSSEFYDDCKRFCREHKIRTKNLQIK